MSGVVLRCPNCGTTKAASGECEACHEAQVRYHCTNHTPGRWLDAPTCPQCGARYGDPPRPPAAPRPPAPAPGTATTPASPSAARRTAPWRPSAGGPWGRRKAPLSPDELLERRDKRAAARDALAARLPELLRTASRGRRSPLEIPDALDGARMGLAFGGCLLRGLFMLFFLFLALVFMSLLLGGSLLQFLYF